MVAYTHDTENSTFSLSCFVRSRCLLRLIRLLRCDHAAAGLVLAARKLLASTPAFTGPLASCLPLPQKSGLRVVNNGARASKSRLLLSYRDKKDLVQCQVPAAAPCLIPSCLAFCLVGQQSALSSSGGRAHGFHHIASMSMTFLSVSWTEDSTPSSPSRPFDSA